MDQQAYEIRLRQWSQIITECNNRDRSISKEQWCSDNGINVRSLYYWQRRIRRVLAGTQLSNPAPSSNEVRSFVDITASVPTEPSAETDPTPPAQPASAMVPELMIQTGDVRIYVSGSVHASTLKTVMQVLRHA